MQTDIHCFCQYLLIRWSCELVSKLNFYILDVSKKNHVASNIINSETINLCSSPHALKKVVLSWSLVCHWCVPKSTLPWFRWEQLNSIMKLEKLMTSIPINWRQQSDMNIQYLSRYPKWYNSTTAISCYSPIARDTISINIICHIFLLE